MYRGSTGVDVDIAGFTEITPADQGGVAFQNRVQAITKFFARLDQRSTPANPPTIIIAQTGRIASISVSPRREFAAMAITPDLHVNQYGTVCPDIPNLAPAGNNFQVFNSPVQQFTGANGLIYRYIFFDNQMVGKRCTLWVEVNSGPFNRAGTFRYGVAHSVGPTNDYLNSYAANVGLMAQAAALDVLGDRYISGRQGGYGTMCVNQALLTQTTKYGSYYDWFLYNPATVANPNPLFGKWFGKSRTKDPRWSNNPATAYEPTDHLSVGFGFTL
ncbi:hypothetical protein HDU76_002211 [Blyttiomyces sp. JEL0837]|nr:hypothetical protein HDU76_002211 [Blyttiomyces sp. JEL0837]